jgi:hypothetical protein
LFYCTQLGDVIDGRDVDGCWYEADLVKVTKNAKSSIWGTEGTTNINNNNNNEDKEVAMDTEETSTETASETSLKEKKSISTLPEGVVDDDGFFYHIKYEG